MRLHQKSISHSFPWCPCFFPVYITLLKVCPHYSCNFKSVYLLIFLFGTYLPFSSLYCRNYSRKQEKKKMILQLKRTDILVILCCFCNILLLKDKRKTTLQSLDHIHISDHVFHGYQNLQFITVWKRTPSKILSNTFESCVITVVLFSWRKVFVSKPMCQTRGHMLNWTWIHCCRMSTPMHADYSLWGKRDPLAWYHNARYV